MFISVDAVIFVLFTFFASADWGSFCLVNKRMRSLVEEWEKQTCKRYLTSMEEKKISRILLALSRCVNLSEQTFPTNAIRLQGIFNIILKHSRQNFVGVVDKQLKGNLEFISALESRSRVIDTTQFFQHFVDMVRYKVRLLEICPKYWSMTKRVLMSYDGRPFLQSLIRLLMLQIADLSKFDTAVHEQASYIIDMIKERFTNDKSPTISTIYKNLIPENFTNIICLKIHQIVRLTWINENNFTGLDIKIQHPEHHQPAFALSSIKDKPDQANLTSIAWSDILVDFPKLKKFFKILSIIHLDLEILISCAEINPKLRIFGNHMVLLRCSLASLLQFINCFVRKLNWDTEGSDVNKTFNDLSGNLDYYIRLFDFQSNVR